MVQINNNQDHPHTTKRETHIANLSILTPEQMKYIQSTDPAPIRHVLDNNHDKALKNANRLRKNATSDLPIETYWFPTPQNQGNPGNHTPIRKRIITELYALEELVRLDPQANQKPPEQF